uniref:Uncharacterized protein n=1 Tax=Rhizophagus irregularis (strain DAOM 181602 / DAOM 197198 / MUCL 43194) TaxID=747089 RepID=U9TXL9_RHIID
MLVGKDTYKEFKNAFCQVPEVKRSVIPVDEGSAIDDTIQEPTLVSKLLEISDDDDLSEEESQVNESAVNIGREISDYIAIF